jgi:hypothetical protein
MSARKATVGPGIPPFRMPDDPRTRDTSAYFYSEAAQVLRDQFRSPSLLVAELRVLMYVSPPCDQLLLDCRGALAHFVLERITRSTRVTY